MRAVTENDRVLIGRMLGAQRHRGPDGEGTYADPRVVLGHRRLSIIDLSENGRQPMSNETGSIWVTFNGEIYNYLELKSELTTHGHVFRSNSDTEVLVHGYEQWGIDGLAERLRGMFAFALYDGSLAGTDREEGDYFFLVRDRLGIKPLYYALRQDGCLVFASEIKALVQTKAVAWDVDLTAVIGFLCLGSVPFPRTWLRVVQCLPPGCVLAVGRRGHQLRQYWKVNCDGPAPDAATLGSELQDAVRRHLIADVPTGIFLSGGLDSAGLVALASRSGHTPLLTLTIAFQEEEFNEAPAAREIAARFRSDHREILVTSEDFAAEFPNVLVAMDQPTADGVNTYFVSHAARKAGLKVVLSGLGGDEVFLGYPHYRLLASGRGLIHLYASGPALLQRAVRAGTRLWGRWRGEERWQRFSYLGGRPLNEGLYLLMRGFFAPEQVCTLLDIDSRQFSAALEDVFSGTNPADNGHIDARHFQAHEFRRYLHDQLLRDSDVFSMAHSIELRVPYLDHKVVELASRIPPMSKLRAGLNKPCLVDAVNDPLLESMARQPKRGFTFPFRSWLKESAEVLERQALSSSLLEPRAVTQLWSQFRQGRLHWSRAWSTAVVAAKSMNN